MFILNNFFFFFEELKQGIDELKSKREKDRENFVCFEFNLIFLNFIVKYSLLRWLRSSNRKMTMNEKN